MAAKWQPAQQASKYNLKLKVLKAIVTLWQIAKAFFATLVSLVSYLQLNWQVLGTEFKGIMSCHHYLGRDR